MRFGEEMFLISVVLALCGAAFGSVNRIVGGNLAAPGQFPYMVSLQMLGESQNLPTRGHRCAGALISYSHAVTTAYCLFNYNTNEPQLINPNEFRVFAGSNLLTNDSSADFIRAIINITIHPEFSGLPALVNNIGVIRLVSAFTRQVVTPLALPASDFNPPDFTPCTVAGWGGQNATVPVNLELRFANNYVYSQNLCTLIYNLDVNRKNIHPSMICAVSYDLQSTNCYGDLGNPLVCGNTFTGVLSLSDNCAISTLPEVYTRISNYTSWIRSVSGASKLIKPGFSVLLLLYLVTCLL